MPPDTGTGARWTGVVFVADQITLKVGFPAARATLGRLIGGELLRRASEDAYGEGLTRLSRAGPVRPLPGSRGLAQVRRGELAVQDGSARVPLRWETAGSPGERFPVLDADLTLIAAGENTTVLALTGAYRPPPGLTAAGSDPRVVRRCAADTIGGFLALLGSAIRHPAGRAEPAHLAS